MEKNYFHISVKIFLEHPVNVSRNLGKLAADLACKVQLACTTIRKYGFACT